MADIEQPYTQSPDESAAVDAIEHALAECLPSNALGSVDRMPGGRRALAERMFRHGEPLLDIRSLRRQFEDVRDDEREKALREAARSQAGYGDTSTSR